MKFYLPYLTKKFKVIQLFSAEYSHIEISKTLFHSKVHFSTKYDLSLLTQEQLKMESSILYGVILPLHYFQFEIIDSPEVDDEVELNNWILNYFSKNLHPDIENYLVRYLITENEIDNKILLTYISKNKFENISKLFSANNILYIGTGLENLKIIEGVDNEEIVKKEFFLFKENNKLILLHIFKKEIRDINIFPPETKIENLFDEQQKQKLLIFNNNKFGNSELNSINILAYCTMMNMVHKLVPQINFLSKKQIDLTLTNIAKKNFISNIRILTILLLIIIGFTLGINKYLYYNNQKITRILAKNKIKYEENHKLKIEIKKLKKKIKKIDEISLQKTNVSGIMELIGKSCNHLVVLDKLQVEMLTASKIIILEGNSDSKLSIAQFIKNLENRFDKNRIELTSIDEKKETTNHSKRNYFKIKIK